MRCLPISTLGPNVKSYRGKRISLTRQILSYFVYILLIISVIRLSVLPGKASKRGGTGGRTHLPSTFAQEPILYVKFLIIKY